jgi:hypothetical protein
MPLTKIQSLGITDGTIVNADINASAAIAGTKISGSFGKVLQVLQATKQDIEDFALATSTLSDVTGLSLSITPSSASNKILVLFTVHLGQNSGGGANPYINIDRGGSNIFIGDASGVRTRTTSGVGIDVSSQYTLKIATQTYLDSPNTTSATTYKLRTGGFNSRAFSVNRTLVNDAEGNTATSTLTLMEIAG